VDFRNLSKVQGAEVRRRAIEDTTRVLGIGFFSTWTYLGARTTWRFLRGRWGVPINRQARLRAYSNLRYELALDTSLDPLLRGLIAESVENLSVNPFERSLAEESRLAAEQHNALTIWATATDGLAARLDRDRRAEMTAVSHGAPARWLFTAARIASIGLYRHLEEPTPDRLAKLSRQRQINYHVARLREVLESSPKPEVVVGVGEIVESVRSLSLLSKEDPSGGKRVAKLLSQLFRQTNDESLRHECLDSLTMMQHEEADIELAKLLSDPATAAWLRSERQVPMPDPAERAEHTDLADLSRNGGGEQ
jgi:hypothetical protein